VRGLGRVGQVRRQAALEPKSLVELKGHHCSLYTTAKQEAIASAREWFVEHLQKLNGEGLVPGLFA
jgi:hypothetical protein